MKNLVGATLACFMLGVVGCGSVPDTEAVLPPAHAEDAVKSAHEEALKYKGKRPITSPQGGHRATGHGGR